MTPTYDEFKKALGDPVGNGEPIDETAGRPLVTPTLAHAIKRKKQRRRDFAMTTRAQVELLCSARSRAAAMMHLSQAVELNPNFALGYAGLGYAFACGGQPERGLEALEQAQRLSPRDPFLAIYAPVVRYMALFALQRYEETIALCRSITTRNPNHVGAWRLMTVSMGLLGRIDEAREALARTLALQPDLSSAHVTNDTVYANPSDRARFLLGLQKAGLKN